MYDRMCVCCKNKIKDCVIRLGRDIDTALFENLLVAAYLIHNTCVEVHIQYNSSYPYLGKDALPSREVKI